MIVIAIIGVLVSLVSVGVMKALEKGRSVAARTEISQLEAAIAAAKQNFGNVDNLPSVIELYSNGPNFKNAAELTVAGVPTYPNTRDTFNFFTKVFGKNWHTTTQIQWLGTTINTNSYATQPKTLYGIEALVFLLGGYADGSGSSPNFLGFSSNPLNPMDVTNTKYKLKGPFYEFDKTRIKAGTNFYTLVNGWEGLYAYFSSSDYKKYFDSNNSAFSQPLKPYVSKYVPPSLLSTPTAYTNSGHIQNGAFTFINNKSFQLVSSGMDQRFGVNFYDSAMKSSSLTPYLQSLSTVYSGAHQIGEPLPYLAGEGCWWLSFTNSSFSYLESGYDDLANFSSTQLGKKDE
jgi:type II secretory pathway pseudopilin PulG